MRTGPPSLFDSESQPHRLFDRGVEVIGPVNLNLSDGFQRGLGNEPGHLAVMRLGGVNEKG